MKTILSVIPMNDEQRARLESAAAGCRVIYSTEKTVTESEVQSAEIILGNVPAEFIHGSERLSLLQLASAGTDQYTPAGVLAPTTVLTNATGAYSKAVSEHMFAVMFSLIKKLHLYRDDQRERVWGDRGTVESITDMTVLVVGLGDIGLAFARMCSALGAYVIGVKRRGGECPDGVHELHLTQELDELLPRADVVLSILPNTPDTRGRFNLDAFSRMKKSAIFLNGGRGNAVVTDDLYRAVHEKMIYAAGIDVTDPEPLPAEHPLWGEENVIITPHISGQFHLAETLRRIVDIAIYNTDAVLNGKPLKNVVDMQTGYKK